MTSLPCSTADPQFARDMALHLALCQEVMSLTAQENQALCGHAYDPSEFCDKRKNLLPRLEQSLMALREWRLRRQADLCSTADSPELKSLIQTVQSLLMKVLLLDRENQQALLRRGLLPPRQAASASSPPPHYAAGLYRRHSRG